MNTFENFPFISIVIIGRNEARNLPACIQSVQEIDYPQDRIEILYVDTDSSDGSPSLARSLGVQVHEESSSFPSPGRARNRGWKEAKYDLIHYIDGDMLIGPDYLKEAVQHLRDVDVACVIGRVRELSADTNLITSVLDYPWKSRRPGLVDAPGAGGTFKKGVLRELGGYDAEILKGQESELGLRIRRRGYKILMIDKDMGIHDYGIRTPLDLWGWFMTHGRSLAHILSLSPSRQSADLSTEERIAKRALLQLPLAVLFTILLFVLGIWWVLLLIPFILFGSVVFRHWQPTQLRNQRILYFTFQYLYKPAIWAGMIEYFVKRFRK